MNAKIVKDMEEVHVYNTANSLFKQLKDSGLGTYAKGIYGSEWVDFGKVSFFKK